jgi:hypothetical protein
MRGIFILINIPIIMPIKTIQSSNKKQQLKKKNPVLNIISNYDKFEKSIKIKRSNE